MAKMLCRDSLTKEERVLLNHLSMHPGFFVMKKLIDEACRLATAEVVKLDPGDPQYIQKVTAAQLTARATNDFAASLILAIRAHVTALATEESQKTEPEDESRLLSLLKNVSNKNPQEGM
jgi:hypothetical protein